MKKSLTSHNRTHFSSAALSKRLAFVLLCSVMLVLSGSPARSQDVAGRIAFGFDAGLNKYYGNYTDSHFGLGGDLFIRWNILDWLSLHAAYNAGVLGYKSTAGSIANEHTLGTTGADGSPVGSLNHIRVGGWELMGSLNVFPDQTFVPYFIAGIEALNFEPDDAAPAPLIGNANARYSKNVLGGALGVGFEMFITDKVTFNGKLLLHLTGTDWLDDYSDPTNFRQDAYLTFGLGFAYYIFAPPLPEKMVETTPANNTTNITNIYNTTVKADTVVVVETDTVYKTKIVKGTIYNFPGTLFIVNTDEFNTAVPNNMQNLRNIKTLMNQCPELRVEIQGHASHEGPAARNQELSDLRAKKIQRWLIDQGVDPAKIVSVVGLGVSDDAVHEPENATPSQLEAARMLNRRMSVKVVEGCR